MINQYCDFSCLVEKKTLVAEIDLEETKKLIDYQIGNMSYGHEYEGYDRYSR